MKVERGKSWVAKVVAIAMGLPDSGINTPVTINVTELRGHILWIRTFGKKKFKTLQWFEGETLCEKRGITTFYFDLEIAEEKVHYQQRALRIASITMPKGMATQVEGIVQASGPGWRIDVTISHPGIGVICRYNGEMRAD